MQKNKVHIIYFSGTGNTAWVVDRLTERLAELGDAVTVTSCEETAAPDVNPATLDILGLAFPVHASYAPSLFRDVIDALPAAPDKLCFVVTTAGYAAGDTAWYAAQPLRAKGYVPFLLANVLVANNLKLPLLSPLPIPGEAEIARKLVPAAAKVNRLAALIHAQEPHVEGAGLFGRLLGVMQRAGVGPFEALAFQGFYADESCVRCGWCVDHCPVRNIEMTGQGVAFLDHCMLCMRCYSFCPVQAIQSTAKTQDTRRFPRYPGPGGQRYPR
jgi:ferredoxin/flavodoxin